MWPALVAAFLIAACEAGPTEPPSSGLPIPTQPAASTEASASASATPASTPTALGVHEPAPPTTAVGKIQGAVTAGVLDEPTAYLYRAYAQVGDPRLPEEYRGDPSEDGELWVTLHNEMAGLPAATREQLLPYFVRPTDPRSVWNQETDAAPGASAAGAPRGGGALPRPAAPPWAPIASTCVGGWISDRVSSTIPILLWSQCGINIDPAAADARLAEARTYLVRHWLELTNLMGVPIGDENDPDDDYPDPPEGDDGLIDIYLLANTTPTGHPRTLATSGYATVRATSPFSGPAGAERASAYMVVGTGHTGLILEATLVHELFHVLQASHNVFGRQDCPPLLLASGCSGQAQKNHWFVEASAAWAEHEFVPTARGITDGPYYLWSEFIKTANGLWFVDGSNEYASWEWPLFMQQEWDAEIIGNTWRAIRGKVGWFATQQAIDQQLSFQERFDDFAVRVFNRELTPGDPVNPRFRAPRLDPNFPLTTPTGDRYIQDVSMDLQLPLVAATTTYRYTITMNSMWSVYLPIAPPPGARTLKFEFSAFAPEVEVDAIVRVGNTWERRELPASETVWCLDKPEDAVEDGYLVFSNHEQVPGALTRPWSITAEEAGCGTPVGTLAYSFLDTAPVSSAPGGSIAIDATVQVRLKPNANIADPYNAMYLNDGSTYGVHTVSKILLPAGVDGCQPSGTSTGTNGGPLEIDSVVGDVWRDENGDNRLGLGISLPVQVETSEFWCSLGSTRSTSETTVQYPECDGTETAAAATASTQTFVFDCDFQGPTQSWSVSGTLVINR